MFHVKMSKMEKCQNEKNQVISENNVKTPPTALKSMKGLIFYTKKRFI